jgi:putative hydrolase of the HAD superfamily
VTQAAGQVVLGFDVGETLLTYSGIQPSWTDHYRDALQAVATACRFELTADSASRASDTLRRYNTRLHPRSRETAAHAIFREILSDWEMEPDPHLASALESFFGYFQQRMTSYPETLDVLTNLKRRGVRLGALTDVPYGMPREFVHGDLAGAGLGQVIDVVLTSVDVGWRKPEPIGFQELARKLGTSPDRLWFIGNEEKDIAGAIAAGATAILIDRARRNPMWGQQHTIRSLTELIDGSLAVD